jgi:hypothetical protein
VSVPGRRLGFAWGVLVAAAVLLVAWVAPGAVPSGSTVVLVLPDLPDADLAEAYVRIQGELRTAGFDVEEAALPRDPDPAKALASAAEERSPLAVIGIFENPRGALEFWILDVRTGRTAVKRMARGGEPARAPEILAISAVEVLLASLSELDIKPAPSSTDESAASPRAAASGGAPTDRAAVPEHPSEADASKQGDRELHWGLELGIGSAVGSYGASVLPAARLAWSPLPILRARVSGLAFGTRPEVTGPGGFARTSQAIILAEVVLRPWDLRALAPQISLGSGAYHFRIEGHSIDGNQGATASQLSAAVDAGAGIAWRQQRHVELAFEAHALLAQPYPSIRFFGVERATAGRPTLLLSATVAGWL